MVLKGNNYFYVFSHPLKTIFQRKVYKSGLHADFFISEISISYNETLICPSNPPVKH